MNASTAIRLEAEAFPSETTTNGVAKAFRAQVEAAANEQPQAYAQVPVYAKAVVGTAAGISAAWLIHTLLGTAAALPLACMFGFVYLLWAMDAQRPAAALIDGALGVATIATGLLLMSNPALAAWLFIAHAMAWTLRMAGNGRDARAPLIAAAWIGFHIAMALLFF